MPAQGPVVLCRDSDDDFSRQSRVHSAGREPCYHSRTKHIDIKFHFLREKVASAVIALEFKPTEEMVADGFTKALPRDKHIKFIKGLGIAV